MADPSASPLQPHEQADVKQITALQYAPPLLGYVSALRWRASLILYFVHYYLRIVAP